MKNFYFLVYDSDFLSAYLICQLTCSSVLNCERVGSSWANLKVLSQHFPEGAEKKSWRNHSENNQHRSLDLKSWSPEYEIGKLISQSWSVLEKWLTEGGFCSCILTSSLLHQLFACRVPATSAWGISWKPLQIWFDFSCKQILLDLM